MNKNLDGLWGLGLWINLIAATQLNSTEKLLLFALTPWMDWEDPGRSICWPSVQSIATAAGLSPRGARNVLNRLKDEGVIEIEGDRRGGRAEKGRSKTNQIRFDENRLRDLGGGPCSQPGVKVVHPSGHQEGTPFSSNPERHATQRGTKVGARDEPRSADQTTGSNQNQTMDQGTRELVNGDVRSQKAPKQFVAPTVEEVAAYCREASLTMDPAVFLDHYESNGWKVGGGAAMRDWQAAARNWARREPSYTQRNGSAAGSKNPQTASERAKEWKAKHGR